VKAKIFSATKMALKADYYSIGQAEIPAQHQLHLAGGALAHTLPAGVTLN